MLCPDHSHPQRELVVSSGTAVLPLQLHPRLVSRAATESSLQTSGLNFSSYQCVDLQLVLSAFRSAYFVDFGVSDLLWSLYVKQRLQLEGWDVVRPPISHIPLGLHFSGPSGPARLILQRALTCFCWPYCRLGKPPPTLWSLQQQRPTSNSWETNLLPALHTTSLCRCAMLLLIKRVENLVLSPFRLTTESP